MKKSLRRFYERNTLFMIVMLIVALLCVAVVVPAVTSAFSRMEGRRVQGVAKNIELSLRLLQLQYQESATPLLDAQRDSGFSVVAERDIRALSGAQGEFYLLKWDALHQQIWHLIYEEDQILVHVELKEDGGYSWQVYHMKKL